MSNLHGYGDNDQAQKDAKALADIIKRQGVGLLIDAIAEHSTSMHHKFELSRDETLRNYDFLCGRLLEQLDERI